MRHLRARAARTPCLDSPILPRLLCSHLEGLAVHGEIIPPLFLSFLLLSANDHLDILHLRPILTSGVHETAKVMRELEERKAGFAFSNCFPSATYTTLKLAGQRKFHSGLYRKVFVPVSKRSQWALLVVDFSLRLVTLYDCLWDSCHEKSWTKVRIIVLACILLLFEG